MPEYRKPREFKDFPPETKILHLVNNSWASLESLVNSDEIEEDKQETINSLKEKVNRLRLIADIPTPELKQKVDEWCNLVEQYTTQPGQESLNTLKTILGDINILITGRGWD